MTNPTLNGSNIGGNVTLNWSTGTGVTSYALWVGSSPGAYDLYAADEGVGTSRTLNLPTDGRMVYVSLHSLIGGVYQSLTYQYRVVGMAPLSITTPVSGTTFTSKSATFNWQGGASQYALWIGSVPRAYDIYAGVEGTNTSKAITNLLPSDGRPVYVTIYSMINGVWQPSDAIYNAWQQP